MNILLIGSGGREHALAKELNNSSRLTKLYSAPGNPGTALFGENIPVKDTDITNLLNIATEKQIDLTIVGPEAPLALGIVDLFEKNGLKIVGPCQEAAQLESSKSWAKKLMLKYNIPTAGYEHFSAYDNAIAYIQKKNTYPIVVKADGLAAGKGVTVADDFSMAEGALKACFLEGAFAEAGNEVIIEDFLIGEEASILAFTDGEVIVPMDSAQDHKPVFNGDKGPNTGGMGAYSPAPVVTKEVSEKVTKRILNPLLQAFKAEGIPLQGIVYAGLMIHNGEPSVVEFNMRFGDPETQAVLPRLKTDLVDVFMAITDKKLSNINLEWDSQAAVCVVMASAGYPGSYEKGRVISGAEDNTQTAYVIQAGTARNETGDLVTSGGRVLGVVGMGESLETAIETAYDKVKTVQFDGQHFRTDIAEKAKHHNDT